MIMLPASQKNREIKTVGHNFFPAGDILEYSKGCVAYFSTAVRCHIRKCDISPCYAHLLTTSPSVAVASQASGHEQRRWSDLRRGGSSVRPSSFLRGSKAAAQVTDRRHRRRLCGVAPVSPPLLGRPPLLDTAGRTLQRRVKVISRHSGTQCL